MWWSEIGVVGRVFVVIAIQVIACFIFGVWGLLAFPVLGILLYIWAYMTS